MTEGLFRKPTLEALQADAAPAEVTGELSVRAPGIWIVLAAIVVFVASAAVWAAVSVIPLSVNVTAVSDGADGYVCFLDADKAQSVETLHARINGAPAVVTTFDARPLSHAEASADLPATEEAPAAWIAERLAIPAWSRRIVVREGAQHAAPQQFAEVSITYGTVRPLGFVFN
jgi:hypothetical protein